MKNYYSITIHYWMISQLELRGVELLVYAVLFDLSKYEVIDFAYLDDIRNWAMYVTNQFLTMKDIEEAVNSLERKELIDVYKDVKRSKISKYEIGISHAKLRKFGIAGEGEK